MTRVSHVHDPHRLAAWFALSLIVLVLVLPRADLPPGSETSFRIVDFQLSGWRDNTSEVLDDWRPRQLDKAAREAISWDWLVIIAYVNSLLAGISLGLEGYARRGWSQATRLGRTMIGFVLAAAVCDLIENLLLIRLLDVGASRPIAQVASAAASVKFSLLGIACAYVAFGFLLILRSRPTRGEVPTEVVSERREAS